MSAYVITYETSYIMNGKQKQRERTRNAILDALADVIAEAGGLEFSIQQVADRAGVTHRTVYNHFPTREALRDGLAERVEELLGATGRRRPDAGTPSLESLAPMVAESYALFESCAPAVRASVILTLASRGPTQLAKRRTDAFRKILKQGLPANARVPADEATAAVRMFLSTIGWHVLTEHLGLSPTKAAATAEWAIRVLLDSAARETRARR
jgi:AcrR family transcriptional regulator